VHFLYLELRETDKSVLKFAKNLVLKFYFLLLGALYLADSELIASCCALKVLICADGATSKLATQLGIVTAPPSSQCSRAYVDGGTHKFKADGVVFWNPDVLPGKSFVSLHYCIL